MADEADEDRVSFFSGGKATPGRVGPRGGRNISSLLGGGGPSIGPENDDDDDGDDDDLTFGGKAFPARLAAKPSRSNSMCPQPGQMSSECGGKAVPDRLVAARPGRPKGIPLNVNVAMSADNSRNSALCSEANRSAPGRQRTRRDMTADAPPSPPSPPSSPPGDMHLPSPINSARGSFRVEDERSSMHAIWQGAAKSVPRRLPPKQRAAPAKEALSLISSNDTTAAASGLASFAASAAARVSFVAPPGEIDVAPPSTNGARVVRRHRCSRCQRWQRRGGARIARVSCIGRVCAAAAATQTAAAAGGRSAHHHRRWRDECARPGDIRADGDGRPRGRPPEGAQRILRQGARARRAAHQPLTAAPLAAEAREALQKPEAVMESAVRISRGRIKLVLASLFRSLRTGNPSGEPQNEEARRQLIFFCNSLHNRHLARPPSVCEMRSLYAFTPHYSEDVTYSMDALQLASDDNASILEILKSLHPDEWLNLCERAEGLEHAKMKARLRMNLKGKEPKEDKPGAAVRRAGAFGDGGVAAGSTRRAG